MKKLFFASYLVLALTACGNRNSSVEKQKSLATVDYAPPAETKMAAEKTPAPNKTVQDTTRKLTKEGEISFETNNISETKKTINNSLNKLGGYVAEESETNNSDNNRKEYNLKVRIPAKNFDQFLNGVSSTADVVDSKNIRIKDVTTEYIDITTQLANKKKLEQQYLELLKKGNKMSDLLEIESKLTEIRTDIESTQGQLNYLVKQVEFSSLDITFYTKQASQDNGQTFGYKLKKALSGGWEFLGALVFGFISVWPVWIIIIAIFMIVRAWRKRRRAKKEKI